MPKGPPPPPPRQGLAFLEKLTKVKTFGSGEAGQTPGWACNHLISRDTQLSPEAPLPRLLTVQKTPLDDCCAFLPLDPATGSCIGTLCSTGQAKIPRIQH